jgi:hypothetical protein
MRELTLVLVRWIEARGSVVLTTEKRWVLVLHSHVRSRRHIGHVVLKDVTTIFSLLAGELET